MSDKYGSREHQRTRIENRSVYVPFPLLSSLPEQRESSLEHEPHERRGHVPAGRVAGDEGQKPDGRDSMQCEQRAHEDCASNDEPSHHSTRPRLGYFKAAVGTHAHHVRRNRNEFYRPEAVPMTLRPDV